MLFLFLSSAGVLYSHSKVERKDPPKGFLRAFCKKERWAPCFLYGCWLICKELHPHPECSHLQLALFCGEPGVWAHMLIQRLEISEGGSDGCRACGHQQSEKGPWNRVLLKKWAYISPDLIYISPDLIYMAIDVIRRGMWWFLCVRTKEQGGWGSGRTLVIAQVAAKGKSAHFPKEAIRCDLLARTIHKYHPKQVRHTV